MLMAYCQNSIQLTSASPFFCSVARVCTLTAVGVACPCSIYQRSSIAFKEHAARHSNSVVIMYGGQFCNCFFGSRGFPHPRPGPSCKATAVYMEEQASGGTGRTRKSTSMKRASGGSKTPIRLRIRSAAVPAPLQSLSSCCLTPVFPCTWAHLLPSTQPLHRR